MKDTLDKKVVLALMAECYEMHQADKQKIEELKAIAEPPIPGLTPVPSGSTSALAAAKSLALKGSVLAGVMVSLGLQASLSGSFLEFGSVSGPDLPVCWEGRGRCGWHVRVCVGRCGGECVFAERGFGSVCGMGWHVEEGCVCVLGGELCVCVAGGEVWR